MEERHAEGARVEAISGAASAPQAFRGDASSRNEKSGNLASCLLVGAVLFRPLAIRPNVSPDRRGRDTPGSQKAPSTKRCIKTATEVAQASNPKTVRKHRAPNGALRHEVHRLCRDALHLSENTERQKVH